MNICISSTFIDLKEYRNIALEVCDIFKVNQCAMELMFSKTQNPVDASLNLVRNCDIYICIIGSRYGTVPANFNKSIAHLEYDEAIKLSKPVYIFNISSLKKEEKLQNFLQEIKLKHVYSDIENIDDFRSSLINTLRQNHFKELKIDSKYLIELESEPSWACNGFYFK